LSKTVCSKRCKEKAPPEKKKRRVKKGRATASRNSFRMKKTFVRGNH